MNQVIFSDESRFFISFGDCDSRVRKSVNFPQFEMVLGYMSITTARKICFFKRSMNAAAYQDARDHFLIPFIENKFGDNELIFQLDPYPEIYKRMALREDDT